MLLLANVYLIRIRSALPAKHAHLRLHSFVMHTTRQVGISYQRILTPPGWESHPSLPASIPIHSPHPTTLISRLHVLAELFVGTLLIASSSRFSPCFHCARSTDMSLLILVLSQRRSKSGLIRRLVSPTVDLDAGISVATLSYGILANRGLGITPTMTIILTAFQSSISGTGMTP